jgi:adenosine deaminase
MKDLEWELLEEGLKEEDIVKIRKVSKGDVHSHCGLGMRFCTFNDWAGGHVKKPSKRINGLPGLDDYIFNDLIQYISNKEGWAFLIEETVKEAIKDGVKVLETSIDCHTLLDFTESSEFFGTILSIRNHYMKDIDFRPELGMAKDITNENLDKLLIPCIDSGVFKSIDLYGDETKEDFERYKDYYKYAKSKGLKLKVHAGEFHDHHNVQKAIEILEVDEIQHGIGAVSSEYVMDLIKERKIRLNICPSSNIILGAVKDMPKHPAKKLFDKGIPLTINTDDLLVFNSGVSEEYLYLYKQGLFSVDELNEIRKSSLL